MNRKISTPTAVYNVITSWQDRGKLRFRGWELANEVKRQHDSLCTKYEATILKALRTLRSRGKIDYRYVDEKSQSLYELMVERQLILI